MSIDLSPYQTFDLSTRPASGSPSRPRLRVVQIVGAIVAVAWTGVGAAGALGGSLLVERLPCYFSTACTASSPTLVTALRFAAAGLLLMTSPVAGQRLHRWWAWLAPLFVGGVGLAIFSALRAAGQI